MSDNKIRISCNRKNLKSLRAFITERAGRCGLMPDAVREMNVVCEELGYNILKYCGLGESDEFEVEVQCTNENFIVVFRDAGTAFDPTAHRGGLRFDENGNLEEGGLGLIIVSKLVDDWDYERAPEGVNIIKIVKNLKGGTLMKINTNLTSTRPRYRLLELSGELDADGAEVLEGELEKAYENGTYNIILDFSGCSYLSSTGLRVLFSTLNKTKGNNGILALTGVEEGIKKLFKVADCEHLFTFHPDLGDFLLSLK